MTTLELNRKALRSSLNLRQIDFGAPADEVAHQKVDFLNTGGISARHRETEVARLCDNRVSYFASEKNSSQAT